MEKQKLQNKAAKPELKNKVEKPKVENKNCLYSFGRGSKKITATEAKIKGYDISKMIEHCE